jgi:hypothetical protein
MRQEKERNGRQIGREEVKLSLSANDSIYRKLKDSNKKLLEANPVKLWIQSQHPKISSFSTRQ